MRDDKNLLCYKAWQKVSSTNHFGLSPVNQRAVLTFHTKEAAIEAQKCLPHFFARGKYIKPPSTLPQEQ
jgi:hypothetical protein